MNRLITGITYQFSRNLGWQDRLIRAIGGIAVLAAYQLGWISGTLGIVLSVFALMIIATAVVARCGVCYIGGACTIGSNERATLDAKGIKYEP